MGKAHRHGVESTAAVFHHPIHPMLIAFPVATLMAAPLTDAAYLATEDPFWSRASRWLLGAGLVSGLVASAVGSIDYFAIREVRRLPSANVHAGGNLVAMALAAFNLSRRREDDRVDSVDVALGAVTVALLGVTAWLGGELSYRHGIGVIADDSETISEEIVDRVRAAQR